MSALLQEPHGAVSSEIENWSAISLLACGPPPARRQVGDEELAARGLPPIAYVDNTFAQDGDRHGVLAILRGEVGYHSVKTDRCAEEMNKAAQVSEAQVLAMMTGSMFGWDVLGAHPWTWRQHLRQIPRSQITTPSMPEALAAKASQ